MQSDINKRTGRPYGDHGTALQAIQFATDYPRCEEADTFLKHWLEGNLDEWPEFYEWLSKQSVEAALSTDAEPVAWIYEDELPENYPYDVMFPYSKVDGVRLFPVYAPLSAQVQDVAQERYRHKKRGSTYTVTARGRLQVDGDLDNEKVVIYRGDDGQTWVRPEYEFNDGRFESLPSFASNRGDIV